MSDFYSQSQNFINALQSGIDSRTGSFSLNIPIANINANYGMGPEINVILSSTSLNKGNNGFGVGFSLPFTTYDKQNKLLTLSTGEKYLINETPVSIEVKQKKLNNFIFERFDDNYKVTYKSGIVEVLEGPSSGNNIKNTLRIESYNGYFVKLKWIFKGFNRLSEIEDESNILLKIDYSDISNPEISVYPQSEENYQVRLNLLNGYLKNLSKTTENYGWIFDYNQDGTIKKIKHPTGLIESIDYQSNVIRFPENIYPPLAAAVRHTLSPQNGQHDIVTSYSYTQTNYLGFGSGLNFKSDTDNLYSVLNRYTYGSTERQQKDGLIIETERTYNNFHLLANEIITYRTTDNSENSLRTDFDYYAVVGIPFDKQPNQFQLIKRKTTTWTNSKKETRQEIYQYEFDEYGNPTLEIQPNNTQTIMRWYPAEGEKDNNNDILCPREKNGFVRFMKEKMITPDQSDYQTPTMSTLYSYDNLRNTEIIIPQQEWRYADNHLLQHRFFEFNNVRGDIEYGRMSSIHDILYQSGLNSASFESHQFFNTELTNNQIVQQTQFQGYDGCQATTKKSYSTLALSLLSETDMLDVLTTYTYDSMGRILSQTTAAGSDYEKTQHWHYEITAEGSLTHQTDAFGNQLKTYFDGLGKPIRQYQFDNNDTKKWHEISSQEYDSIGDIKTKKVFDTQFFNSETNLYSINTTIKNNGWGEMDSVLFSNGLESHQSEDPILLTETRTKSGSLDGKYLYSGQWKTVRSNKNYLPKSTQRINTQGQLISEQSYFWDGLGRLRKQIDELGHITEWTYDVYDRVFSQTLPDGTIVEKTYVPYLMENEISSISMTSSDGTHWILGKQEFDSLGRLTKKESGGRVTIYHYENASPSPSFVTLPSGENVYYEYIAELANTTSQIEANGVIQRFSYDSMTGQLLHASEGQAKNSNEWNNSGTLKQETITLSGKSHNAQYHWTLQGEPVSYCDITGAMTSYQRDQYGKINRIDDKDISTDLVYDALGRLVSQIVTDNTSLTSIITRIDYDEFNQEITREITDSQSTQLCIQNTWLKNGLLSAKKTTLNGHLLKNEEYHYDVRNRLIDYVVEGDELPSDGYGQKIRKQSYNYDALNNLMYVNTTLENQQIDIAKYYYENEKDPTQLTSISHSHYPIITKLEYDQCGRMVRDEAGRTLHYDVLGRLMSIDGQRESSYHYNAFNQLVNQTFHDDDHQLFYRGHELVNEIAVEQNKKTRLIKSNHNCLAFSDDTKVTLTSNGHNDSLLWSLKTNEKEGKIHHWMPYGEGEATEYLPGFNGERTDPITGVYHLGNGYRAYNPRLMRFHCPDSMSPFGDGGINPYVYCAGDPINHTDPSGHMSGQQISSVVLGGIGIILAGVTFGTSLAATGAIIGGITLALSLASEATGIASAIIEKDDPKTSAILGWTSLALGILSIGVPSVQPISKNISKINNSLIKKGLYNHAKNADLDLLVIGRRANVTEPAALKNFKVSAERGKNFGSVLDTANWSIEGNDAWIRGGVDGKKIFHLAASDINISLLKDSASQLPMTVTARELIGLSGAGYSPVISEFNSVLGITLVSDSSHMATTFNQKVYSDLVNRATNNIIHNTDTDFFKNIVNTLHA